MEIIEQLVSQLGIDEGQAKGGAGLLFQLAQDKLSSGEFGQLTDAIPQVSELVDAAPASGGGLLGSLGGLASAFGGGAGNLGTLASLAGGFQSLGLDSAMISKFVPLVLSFVQQQGGDGMRGLLEKVLGSNT